MPTLTVETNANQTAFRPGAPIDGIAGWEFGDDPPKWVEVRLYWRTAGKGDEDAVIADAIRFDEPAAVDAQVFNLVAPDGPLSYQGRLIEVRWGIEVVARKTRETAQLDLTLSTSDQPVRTS